MGPDPLPWKITSGYRFPCMDPLERQLDPLGSIASRGRSIRPSAKYVDTCMAKQRKKKELSGLPLAEFSGSAHIINDWTSYFQLCVCLEFSLFLFNPYKTSVLFVARRQTVQT